MKINNIYSLKIEAISYILLMLGVLGDHISTNIALSRSYIRESNPIALNLMNQGLWVQTDLLLVIVSIAIVFITTRVIKNTTYRAIFLLPAICGLFRLGVTFWNISLLF
jgi:hypothetical protein